MRVSKSDAGDKRRDKGRCPRLFILLMIISGHLTNGRLRKLESNTVN
jgi:hypothetical protein